MFRFFLVLSVLISASVLEASFKPTSSIDGGLFSLETPRTETNEGAQVYTLQSPGEGLFYTKVGGKSGFKMPLSGVFIELSGDHLFTRFSSLELKKQTLSENDLVEIESGEHRGNYSVMAIYISLKKNRRMLGSYLKAVLLKSTDSSEDNYLMLSTASDKNSKTLKTKKTSPPQRALNKVGLHLDAKIIED